MNPSIDHYFQNLYQQQELKYRFAAADLASWQIWQQDLRKELSRKLGLDRLAPPAGGLNPQLLETVTGSDYIRYKYLFTFCPGLDLPVYVLMPEEAKLLMPAVLACHGHGYGVKAMLGLDPDGQERREEPDYQKDFALELVRRGFLVVAPELAGFGEARPQADQQLSKTDNACHALSTGLLAAGLTMAGLRVHQALCLLDYLVSRPDIDNKRIGCMGISGGGLVCSFAAALDDRIKTAVVSGYANTFKDSILSVHHCVDNYIPGILDLAEMPDIISLIAPRPLLIEGGTEDPIFPIAASRRAGEQIRSVYKLLQAESQFAEDFFPGEHQIGGEKAYPWLEHWLG